MSKTKVVLLGSGFIAKIHLECYHRFLPEVDIAGIYSRDIKNAYKTGKPFGVKKFYDDIDKAIQDSKCDVVDICLPNFLHARTTIKAANAGKHVIIEKPLCLNLIEAKTMIDACNKNKVKLMYAEELCFAPKYERARMLVDNGAIGNVFQLRQCEKHSGPHSAWFYDIEKAGGGVLMDMGCHAFGWFRWILKNKTKPKYVSAHLNSVLHKDKTKGEDNSITIVEFDNGTVGIAENSWAKPGGMDDRIEIYGTEGVIYADLFMGNSALTYSNKGYDYAMEKATTTQGWSFTVYEESFNQGYPHELKHFIDCVRFNKDPLVTGEDGKAILEIICAAYQSTKLGKKVSLPFETDSTKPIDLWLNI